jgi:hypothetical protein
MAHNETPSTERNHDQEFRPHRRQGHRPWTRQLSRRCCRGHRDQLGTGPQAARDRRPRRSPPSAQAEPQDHLHRDVVQKPRIPNPDSSFFPALRGIFTLHNDTLLRKETQQWASSTKQSQTKSPASRLLVFACEVLRVNFMVCNDPPTTLGDHHEQQAQDQERTDRGLWKWNFHRLEDLKATEPLTRVLAFPALSFRFRVKFTACNDTYRKEYHVSRPAEDRCDHHQDHQRHRLEVRPFPQVVTN